MCIKHDEIIWNLEILFSGPFVFSEAVFFFRLLCARSQVHNSFSFPMYLVLSWVRAPSQQGTRFIIVFVSLCSSCLAGNELVQCLTATEARLVSLRVLTQELTLVDCSNNVSVHKTRCNGKYNNYRKL